VATQTMASADAVLKVSYGKLHEQLRDDVPLWKNIERTSDHLTSGGQEAQFAVRTKRNRGSGARNEMEDLPTPGRQGKARAKLFLKNYYQGISVSGQTFEQASTNAQAFISVVDDEVSRAYTDAKIDMNRMAYGDGQGILASAVGANADTTLTVDSTHWLMEGDFVDIVDLSALPTVTLLYTNIEVTAIDEDTETITLSVSVTTADGDMVVRHGNYGEKEIEGIDLLIGTGELHDINPATASIWKSYVRTGVGDLEQIDMQRAIQATFKNGAGPSRIFTDWETFNAYWDLFEDKRRFTNDAKSGVGDVSMTFNAGKLGAIPIEPDFDAPAGTMFFVDESALVLNQLHDIKWMNRDGSMWTRIAGKDGYEAMLYYYGNLGIYRRNSSAKLSGINPLT
jgi:hypothetical protein